MCPNGHRSERQPNYLQPDELSGLEEARQDGDVPTSPGIDSIALNLATLLLLFFPVCRRGGRKIAKSPQSSESPKAAFHNCSTVSP